MELAKNNNNNKKRNNDYFSQSIQQYGENFLMYKTSRDLEMDAIKIFRGLARGNINIDKYGMYFLDDQLLHSCIRTAYNKSSLYNISYTGVNMLKDSIFASGNVPSADIITILDYHKKCAEAYNIILDGLNNVLNTKNINYLICMANTLADYRNYV